MPIANPGITILLLEAAYFLTKIATHQDGSGQQRFLVFYDRKTYLKTIALLPSAASVRGRCSLRAGSRRTDAPAAPPRRSAAAERTCSGLVL